MKRTRGHKYKMMNELWSWLSPTISVLSLFIAVFVWRVQSKEHKILKRTYIMDQDDRLNRHFEVRLVSSNQVNGNVSLKLAVYNLDSNPLLIQSISIEKRKRISGFFMKQTDEEEYERIPHSYWWPGYDENSIEPKFFHQEYKKVLVTDVSDIQIIYPGEIDEETYKVKVTTNRGIRSSVTSIKVNGYLFSTKYIEERHIN